jgi:preprotein translocase subunit YajC
MDHVWILAQTDSGQAPSRIGSEPVQTEGEATTTVPDTPGGTTEDTQQQKQGSPWTTLLPFILIMVVMYVLMFRGPRKQQQQHKQMVQSLKKNDRVRTIGGILGTIVDIRGDEVVLKVDEQNNTKIKISTSAIGKNLSQEGKE